ncbi:MAG TPA: insulinase family protein [Flavihumibacter sp.]|nr:insulinase family protein [Flavihumibacter sp.]
MKNNCFKPYLLSLGLGLLLVSNSQAQTKLEAELPKDSAVMIGKLDNGLTYYIRKNKKPEQKVELRLALKAGSIVENDDQQGLAHMAEHMAFNGTKNFKKNDIVSFLQDIGVGFGNDLNAYTSFDETVYILPIPTDKPGNLEKGFQVLEDWAHQVTYLTDDINNERAVILEESRLGKGAQDRMMKQVFPKLLASSKYASRLPIGKDSIIKNFNPDLIRQFYKDWYRPNLMAVVVVGDIDPAKALAMVKKHFGGMKNPGSERARDYSVIPPYTQPEALVVTDKEATSYNISVYYPMKKMPPQNTGVVFREGLVRELYTSMLNQRLQEITQQPNPPFLMARTNMGEIVGGYEGFSVYGGVGTGDVKKGVEAIYTELERAEKYGFTQAELDRVKKSLISSMERAYNNREKTESDVYVDEYVANFLTGEPIPGISREFALVNEFVPAISLAEVSAAVKKDLAADNPLLVVMGPDAKAGETLPTPSDLLATVAAVQKADIKPYEEKAVATSLLASKPAAGKVLRRTEDKALGTTELTLSNGVTVTLKPTTFKDDQVLFNATRPGGKNYYPLADRYSAEYAVPVVAAMGMGDFSPTDLRKLLAGKTVSVSANMGEISDGLKGNSGNKDLETLFQLIYLQVTAPRKDTALFQSFVTRNKTQVAGISSNPQAAFIDTMYQVMFANNPLAPIAVPKPVYFDKINLDRALAIYKERIGDASTMHYVFVGSFKTDSIIPLIETYLASQPSSGKKFERIDNKVRPITGVKDLQVNKGKEAKSLILNFYTGEVPYSEDLSLKAQAVAEVLNIRIIEELREKIQGIYGGGIYGELEKYPYANYSFVLQLPCGPEKVDTLLKAAKAEIALIGAKGPEQKYLDKVKKQWLEQYKVSVKENNFWLDQLQSIRSNGADPRYLLNYEALVQKLTTADLKMTAQKLFNGKNIFSAVLMPEGSAPIGGGSKKGF